MKILKLRFLNLNSLYGEWEIDFTSPEYISNGIFAITGSTGSGKSTILDAICLALYGSTPRLKVISKSTNEIMSRKTWNCFSEVTFKVKTGIYTCHWSQHRAHKSPDGNLLDSKHEISETETGKVLGTKKRDVSNLVIEKSGMDLDRFTRSILLAQGSFSAFLKATADERAPILEQITGTEIYSNISKNIHERQKSETDKYSLLVAETEGISFLSEEEEISLKEKLNLDNVNHKLLTDKIDKLQNFISWKNRILNLETELEHLIKKHKSVLSDIVSFKLQKDFLEKVIKASELDGDYAIFNNLLDIQIKEKQSLSSISLELPVVIKEKELSENKYREIEVKLKDLKDLYISEQSVIKKVREIDFDLRQKKLQLKDKSSVYKTKQKNIELIQGQISDLEKNRLSIQKESILINDYIQNNKTHAELVLGLSGLKHQLKVFQGDIDKRYFREIDIDNQNKKILKLEEERDSINKSYEIIVKDKNSLKLDIENENNTIKKHLDGLTIKECRVELKNLLREKVLLDKISSLEEERKKLKIGTACPLCGSKDHPYLEDYDINLDEKDLEIRRIDNVIQNFEESETRIHEMEVKISKVDLQIVESQKSLLTIALQLDEANKNKNRIKDELKQEIIGTKEIEDSLKLNLKKYKISNIDFNKTDELIKMLDKKSDLWLEYSEKSDKLLLSIKDIDSNIKRFRDDCESQKIDIQNEKVILKKSELELKSLTEVRTALYGEKDPEAQELELNLEIKRLEKGIDTLRLSNEHYSHKFVELNTKKEALVSSVNSRDLKLKELDLNLQDSYNKLGFSSKNDFLKHRISNSEKDILLNRAGELDSELSSILARKSDKESDFKAELDKKLTEREIPELKEKLNKASEESKTLGESIGAIKQQLQDNLDSKSKLRDKEKDIESQKIECQNWQKLHSLIGSADGKKYRNFAQGLTFEQMVFFANHELVKLSDRYLLIRDKENPLELNVIDNYQAGEIRSTKNLSGGESFIISLSLALGLSRMASNKVRVDSLFLDEGFGTLDEEALETALDTLSSLHQDGKLIGVISHIPALKKRILTQISISKNAGGRGSLSGPGCKHL